MVAKANRQMKIITVVGARPQFVKAGILSKALNETPQIDNVLVHTGQHYDAEMSRIFFDELEIPAPKHNLRVGSGSHGSQTGRMLEGLEAVFKLESPDWVLVVGDTNSTIAGVLAAVKLHISVAHVEAGLRSFNRKMPEEINRVLADHASDLLFVPTQLAVSNLFREGIGDSRVHLVGDVMCDATLYYSQRAEAHSTILQRMALQKKEYILTTIHRPENTDSEKNLRTILAGLSDVATHLPIIFPIHPRTRKATLKIQGMEKLSTGIRFVDPVGYLDMLMLERNARLIATDSGGIQKEAFFFSVPCVTLRNETEWRELVDFGCNHLTPPVNSEAVSSSVLHALNKRPQEVSNPYGDGHASKKIVQILCGSDRSHVQAYRPARLTPHASVV